MIIIFVYQFTTCFEWIISFDCAWTFLNSWKSRQTSRASCWREHNDMVIICFFWVIWSSTLLFSPRFMSQSSGIFSLKHNCFGSGLSRSPHWNGHASATKETCFLFHQIILKMEEKQKHMLIDATMVAERHSRSSSKGRVEGKKIGKRLILMQQKEDITCPLHE